MKQNRILKGRFNVIMHLTHFLAHIYILGGMILKMKKFLVQWRKFELKISFRNEVTNF